MAGALASVPAVATGQVTPPNPDPPPPTSPTPAPAEPPIEEPSPRTGATTARVVVSSNVLSQPGKGKRIWRARTTTDWSRQEQTLLVLASATARGQAWLRVLLPIRPNGVSGWIPRTSVVLDHTPYWLIIRKEKRLVSVYRAGRLERRVRAVIGAPRTPTPGGLAAIYERARQPNPQRFLGSWVLSITALSDVLQEFGGADGRIGIHGRGGASLRDPLGSAESHGCVRLDNAAVSWIAKRVPQGTPVEILK